MRAAQGLSWPTWAGPAPVRLHADYFFDEHDALDSDQLHIGLWSGTVLLLWITKHVTGRTD